MCKKGFGSKKRANTVSLATGVFARKQETRKRNLYVHNKRFQPKNQGEFEIMNQIEQTLDSREVAEMVGKDHNKLLRDIREYCNRLSLSKIGQSEFFEESTYKTERGKEYPCYLVTKKGCEFIAHKLTGIKGTEFTARYINRFHDMEEQIRKPKSALEMLQLQSQALFEVNEKVDTVKQELDDFKQDMPLLAVECDRITTAVHKRGVDALGGKESSAYKDSSMRGRVYQDIHRELKRQFGVSTYKAIKRNQCDHAVSVVEQYELPFVLMEQIRDCNAQMSMEGIRHDRSED